MNKRNEHKKHLVDGDGMSFEFEGILEKNETKELKLISCTPKLPCRFKAILGCGICIFECLCTQVKKHES
jgi:hypothetical protein